MSFQRIDEVSDQNESPIFEFSVKNKFLSSFQMKFFKYQIESSRVAPPHLISGSSGWINEVWDHHDQTHSHFDPRAWWYWAWLASCVGLDIVAKREL
jgi:hypothetical protein